jgi:uncharacterized protein
VKYRFLETNEIYDGAQLVSLNNYLKHGLLGDSIVAWVGPCDVAIEHMMDGEDLVAGSSIRGDKMVHFIVEKFDSSLLAAVALQRLLASIAKDSLNEPKLRREGDDIYWDDRKLSISIATQSPVSSLIHFAVNVVNSGAPVVTCSLGDLEKDPHEFAMEVMMRFAKECESIVTATKKVRWAR